MNQKSTDKSDRTGAGIAWSSGGPMPDPAADTVRILLLADTHIGFDMPRKPKIRRRRRGVDFLDNFKRALEPALRGDVDIVVHGGDLQFRSKVPAGLTAMALEPLFEVASAGVPVFIVPGNHERSAIHQTLFEQHELLRIFEGPETFVLDIRGTRVALGGFPFVRQNIEGRFAGLLNETGLRDSDTDFRVLCLHQAVEGSTVGPADFTFRRHPDVVRHADIPPWVDLALAGHIHRAQALTRRPDPGADHVDRVWNTPAFRRLPGQVAGHVDRIHRPVSGSGQADLIHGARAHARDSGGSRPDGVVPVLYPGSVERTSFAERFEPKGYLLVELVIDAPARWRFVELPARPMFIIKIDTEPVPADGRESTEHLKDGNIVKEAGRVDRPGGRESRERLKSRIAAEISRLPEDAVVRILLRQPATLPGPGPANLSELVRETAPKTMTIEIRPGKPRAGLDR